MNPDLGFDLKKIKSHYESRRALRAEKMVLRYGELCPLLARDQEFKDYAPSQMHYC